MKTQGNMLSQTENSPATEQKHMEYCDLTDREFKDGDTLSWGYSVGCKKTQEGSFVNSGIK